VRYLKEIDSIETMVSNDWDPAAVELMKKNIVYNNLKEDKCESKSIQNY
jgi:tRNA G26 N,N-dimethylase Trm1